MKTFNSSRTLPDSTSSAIRRIILSALEEDLGRGDVTTDSVVDPSSRGTAVLVAREDIVLAGLFVFEQVLLELCPDIIFHEHYAEGAIVSADQPVCEMKGPLGPILKGERTGLNFLQRMCGIAGITRRYVEKIDGSGAKILDTRKTAPGLRILDKYAVQVGGGVNHRFGLFDGVLIKDNHVAAAGSVGEAVRRARKKAPHTLKIEVEVETLDEVREAAEAGADIVLLDNMPPAQMEQAVKLLRGKALVEASGGITLENVGAVAATGVDLISVGALTHSVRAADLSLEFPAKSRKQEA